jgi:uncharacterized protein YceH (UPF0502 family)
MDNFMTVEEARVVGSLIEKEMTTPEYYPLTLNALMAACNQKSNRAPALQLSDTDIVRALDCLRDRRLAWETTSSGGRTPKYGHRVQETLKLQSPQRAVLCELLVRGPQTAAELRIRASRMTDLPDVNHVMTILDELANHVEGPMVVKLPRESGQREERYAHLLSGPVKSESRPGVPEPARQIVAAENARLSKLEAEVASLREDMTALRAEWAAFKNQF